VLLAVRGAGAQSTPTPAPTLDPLQLAREFSGTNDDWTPIERDFDGVPMVFVPAGCFDMGEGGEGGRQCLEAPFWIGKTEVTNVQFQDFIDADGYMNPDHWTEAGWEWRTPNNITQPGFWENSQYNAPDQPVAGVNWYEAAAYATWRGGRLPTEAEWEYAARGMDGWAYPWGNNFDGTRLNYCDSNCPFDSFDWKDSSVDDNFALIAPVGSYPSGASWIGALDMSGNLYEWTSTAYANYPYNADDGRENVNDMNRRILRGGSWISNDDYTRATSLQYYYPVQRDDMVGFRVVWMSSPIMNG
jgi:formylglycine-generating enzyme required for sulfatase activity